MLGLKGTSGVAELRNRSTVGSEWSLKIAGLWSCGAVGLEGTLKVVEPWNWGMVVLEGILKVVEAWNRGTVGLEGTRRSQSHGGRAQGLKRPRRSQNRRASSPHPSPVSPLSWKLCPLCCPHQTAPFLTPHECWQPFHGTRAGFPSLPSAGGSSPCVRGAARGDGPEEALSWLGLDRKHLGKQMGDCFSPF